MGSKKFLSVFILVLTFTVAAFAAETDVSGKADETGATAGGQSQEIQPSEDDIQWVWGEVVGLDIPGNTLTLKYLDYETDQEKDITLSVDEKTSFENIKNLADIKNKDTLSIDYISGPEGKNIARNIGLENPDSYEGSSEDPA